MSSAPLETLLRASREAGTDAAAVDSAGGELATVLRSADERTALGPQLIPACCALLRSTSGPSIGVIRALGNVCVDNDANRQLLLDNDAPLLLARAAQASSDLSLRKAAVGALMNLSLDYAPSAKAYVHVGALGTLLPLLFGEGALYQFGSPAEDGETRATVLQWLLRTFEEVINTKTVLPPALASAIVTTLTELILSSSPAAESAPLDEELATAESEILVVAAELVETLTLDDAAPSRAALTAPSLFVRLVDFVEQSSYPRRWPADDEELVKSFSTVKAVASRALIAAAGEDRVVQTAFAADGQTAAHAWLVARMVRWVAGDAAARPDLVITGSVALANIARSDRNCSALVTVSPFADTLPSALARILIERSTPASIAGGKPGEHTQILHGVLGLLKHLSVPPENKVVLGRLGVIEPTLGLLRPAVDVVQPLQHAAIGVLKHLCTANVDNAVRLVEADDFPLLGALVGRTEDVRLRSEATRVLANAARSLWMSAPTAGEDDAAKRAHARTRLASHQPAIDALAELVRTGERYPILVNEGVTALALLATDDGAADRVAAALTSSHSADGDVDGATARLASLDVEAGDAVVKRTGSGLSPSASTRLAPPTATTVLRSWLASRSLAAELRGNVCALVLATAVRSSPERRRPLALALNEPLRALATQSGASEPLRTRAEQALNALALST